MVEDLKLPNTRKYMANATFLKRTLSFIIDLLVIDFFIIGAFSVTIASMFPKKGVVEMMAFLSKNPSLISEGIFLMTLTGVLSFSYLFYFQKNLGQTIGMKIMNLQIIGENKLETWQFIVRNLYIIPVIPFIFIPLVDLVYLIIYNKRFSEIITKSYLMEEHLI